MAVIFGFATVLVLGLLFLILTIFSRTKFAALYGTFGFVFWFALAGVNLIAFETTPSLHILSFLWFAIGLFCLLLGLVFTFLAVKADTEQKEMQVD